MSPTIHNVPDDTPSDAQASETLYRIWPHIAVLLEEAVESPRGLKILFDTWDAAISARNQFAKGRKRAAILAAKLGDLQPGDPGFGTSAFDTLTFSIEPCLDNTSITVTFLWSELQPPSGESPQNVQLLNALRAVAAALHIRETDLLSENTSKMQTALRGIGSTCNIRIQKADGTVFAVESALTFQLGWEVARKALPAHILIRNSNENAQVLNVSPL